MTMPLKLVTAKGLLVARSPILFVEPPSTLLELQTPAGDKIRIVAPKVDLPADIIPGNYYKLTNLCGGKLKEFDSIMHLVDVPSKIERLEDCPDCPVVNQTNYSKFDSIMYLLDVPSKIERLEDCPDCPVVNQTNYSFHGKVTAADKDFAIYEVDNSKTLVLCYLTLDCGFRTPEVGDHVDIKMAHRYTASDGKDYYVLCFRSYIHVRSNKPSAKRKDNVPVFLQFVNVYGLNVECLLWLRENHNAVKTCLRGNFLKSLGASNLDVIYAEIPIMLLSSNEEIKQIIQSAPHERSVLQEFFAEPHSCLTMQLGLQLPSNPISVKEFLDSQLKRDVCLGEVGSSWKYDICELQDNRPILACAVISKTSHRLCLVDGSGAEVPIVLTKQSVNVGSDPTSLHGKIILVEKAILVIEEYVEENNKDPAAEYLETVKHNFFYLMTDLSGVRILCPFNETFCEITHTRILNFLNRKNCAAEKKQLVPLRGSSISQNSFISKKCIVLHKTPLQITPNKEIFAYLMVCALSSGTENTAGRFDTRAFLEIRQPHADFYDVIPLPGEVELSLPKDKVDSIMRRRCPIPSTYGLSHQLKTTNYIPIPAEVGLSVGPRNIATDTYSIADAVNNPDFTGELVCICGMIMKRVNEKGKFQRERKLCPTFDNFGLPGYNGVIVLNLGDPQAKNPGDTSRVYLSWPNTHQYPLGLIPGATVVLSFVYKAFSKSNSVYFRSTHLSSVEIIRPPALSSRSNVKTDFVEVPPIGQWVYPHELKDGASGWCVIDNPHLVKFSITTACKQCAHPYTNGACSFVGCWSRSGAVIRASARVVFGNMNDSDCLFVGERNVQTLLNVSDNAWNALLTLASKTGGLCYSKNFMSRDAKEEMKLDTVGDLTQAIFTTFCEKVFAAGQQYHCYCRRFRSCGREVPRNLFCIALFLSCSETALKGIGNPLKRKAN